MIEPIVDHTSHQKALRRIEKLWGAKPGSREERELDALATLVDTYERRTFPIEALDPLEAISLTLPMIRRIHQKLGIPAEVLISKPPPRHARSVRRTRKTESKRIRDSLVRAVQQREPSIRVGK